LLRRAHKRRLWEGGGKDAEKSASFVRRKRWVTSRRGVLGGTRGVSGGKSNFNEKNTKSVEGRRKDLMRESWGWVGKRNIIVWREISWASGGGGGEVSN